MDVLITHLRTVGIPGVMLTVGGGNKKGRNFYQKYGFNELERNKNEVAMGFLLRESDQVDK